MWRGGVLWAVLMFGSAFACGGRYEVGQTGNSDNPNGGPGSLVGGRAASDNGGSISKSGALTSGSGGNGMTAGSSGGEPTNACNEQAQAFQSYWTELMIEFSSIGCSTADDCRSYYYQSSCEPSCMLLTSAAHRALTDGLNRFASENCDDSCAPKPWPECPPVAAVQCVNGRCK